MASSRLGLGLLTSDPYEILRSSHVGEIGHENKNIVEDDSIDESELSVKQTVGGSKNATAIHYVFM